MPILGNNPNLQHISGDLSASKSRNRQPCGVQSQQGYRDIERVKGGGRSGIYKPFHDFMCGSSRVIETSLYLKRLSLSRHNQLERDVVYLLLLANALSFMDLF